MAGDDGSRNSQRADARIGHLADPKWTEWSRLLGDLAHHATVMLVATGLLLRISGRSCWWDLSGAHSPVSVPSLSCDFDVLRRATRT